MTTATYEEYNSATKFARWKYKYGLFVLIGCWLCFLILIYLVWHYAVELSTHPAIYMVKQLGVNECYCYDEGVTYYINSTAIEQSLGGFG